MGTSVTPGLGSLVAAGFSPSTSVATGYLAHRVVIPGIGSAFVPGDPDPLPDTDFYISSRRRSTHPWIAQRGDGHNASADISIGGQRLDPALGHSVDSEIQIRLIDAPSPIAAVACDINSPLIAEGNAGLDGNAISSGDWVVHGSAGPSSWWGDNANGPFISGFALFSWSGGGTWVRSTWIARDFDGTEGGGAPFVPFQLVGFRFRINWTLNTGPSAIWVDVNGNLYQPAGPSFSFWTIDEDTLNNRVDTVIWCEADVLGLIKVKLGWTGAPSCNVYCQFSDLEAVSCADVITTSATDRYVTSWLADANARQQLLGRKAYLEQSTDGGATWSEVVYSGFVKQLTLDQSLTYLLTLGDSGKGRRVSRAWAGLNPVADFIP